MTTNYTKFREGLPFSEYLRKRVESGKVFVFSSFLQQLRLLDEMQKLNTEAIRHINRHLDIAQTAEVTNVIHGLAMGKIKPHPRHRNSWVHCPNNVINV